MSQLLEAINAGDLLERMPSTVRSSLETLERAGTDWNAVGNLLAATPTTGIAHTGTGQWPADLWQGARWEFRSFLCTDSETYASLRSDWEDLTRQSPARAVGALATRMAARLGVASGVLLPMVTWLFVVARRNGQEGMCLILAPTRSRESTEQSGE